MVITTKLTAISTTKLQESIAKLATVSMQIFVDPIVKSMANLLLDTNYHLHSSSTTIASTVATATTSTATNPSTTIVQLQVYPILPYLYQDHLYFASLAVSPTTPTLPSATTATTASIPVAIVEPKQTPTSSVAATTNPMETDLVQVP